MNFGVQNRSLPYPFGMQMKERSFAQGWCFSPTLTLAYNFKVLSGVSTCKIVPLTRPRLQRGWLNLLLQSIFK
jgi:hypothetical protein